MFGLVLNIFCGVHKDQNNQSTTTVKNNFLRDSLSDGFMEVM